MKPESDYTPIEYVAYTKNMSLAERIALSELRERSMTSEIEIMELTIAAIRERLQHQHRFTELLKSRLRSKSNEPISL